MIGSSGCGLVTNIAPLENGHGVEVGVIGREGLVGTCAARHDATTVVAWAEIAPARIARTGYC